MYQCCLLNPFQMDVWPYLQLQMNLFLIHLQLKINSFAIGDMATHPNEFIFKLLASPRQAIAC